jgi:hypothetical protein
MVMKSQILKPNPRKVEEEKELKLLFICKLKLKKII